MRYWIILLLTLSITISQDKGYIDSTMIRNPGVAWKLGFIPGLGQLYNGKYLKAFSFLTAEYIAVHRFNEFKDNDNLGLRNTYAWWIFGLYIWGILDAYVDAHLSTFPIKRLESNNELDTLKISNK